MGSRSAASHSTWDDRFDRDELGLDPEEDEDCEEEEEEDDLRDYDDEDRMDR